MVVQAVLFVLTESVMEDSNCSKVNGHFPWQQQVLTAEGVTQPKRFSQMPRNPKSAMYHPLPTPSSHAPLGLTEYKPNGPKSGTEMKLHIAVEV